MAEILVRIMNFKIMQWNCRSLRANRESLFHLINSFDPSIILLNESWISSISPLSITNYRCIRDDRAGAAVLIKKRHPLFTHVYFTTTYRKLSRNINNSYTSRSSSKFYYHSDNLHPARRTNNITRIPKFSIRPT